MADQNGGQYDYRTHWDDFVHYELFMKDDFETKEETALVVSIPCSVVVTDSLYMVE